MDLELPRSLTLLEFGAYRHKFIPLFWALQEAVKCAEQGVQLHKFNCARAEAYLQPAQWGTTLDEQHRRLGGRLGSLRELEVWGGQEQMLSAVGAVASAAPSLVSLKIVVPDPLPRVEVSPICSASLESIMVEWGLHRGTRPKLPPQVLMTLLPGCTRLREVGVYFRWGHVEGAAVKLRCHCCSRRSIMPVEVYDYSNNQMLEEMHAGAHNKVMIRFLHMPPSQQDVQEYTVLFACHAAGSDQAPLWGHAVMPAGIL